MNFNIVLLLIINIFYLSINYDIGTLENYKIYNVYIPYNYYLLYEFNSTSYFKDENSTIYFIIKELSYTRFSYLYVYYNKSKINITNNKVYNVDLSFRFIDYYQFISFNSKNNSMVYLVLVDQGNDNTRIKFEIINNNDYFNISSSSFTLNAISFKENKQLQFTYSFKINSFDEYLYYESSYYASGGSITTIIMDKDKNQLNKITGSTQCTSLKKYIEKGVNVFFIQMIVKYNYFQFTINHSSYNLYTSITRSNYIIEFPETKYTEYYFYIDVTDIYYNYPSIITNATTLRDPYVYLYRFDTTNITEIKDSLFIKNPDKITKYYEIYQFYIDKAKVKSVVVKMLTKNNISNFYIKILYNYYNNIYSFKETLVYNYEQYYIYKYVETNESVPEDTILSLLFFNNPENWYVELFTEINDIYPENYNLKTGNLIDNNYATFNYIPGTKFIFLSNFNRKNYSNFKIKLINNKEYYNFTDDIYYSSNFSLTFKFNKVKTQKMTLQFSPLDNNKYLYFQLQQSNLEFVINSFTDNETIDSEEDYFFKTNYTKMYFDLIISSKNEFSEFSFVITIVDDIKFYQRKIFKILLIITITLVSIIIISIIIIVLLRKRKRRKDKLNDIENIVTPYNENSQTDDGTPFKQLQNYSAMDNLNKPSINNSNLDNSDLPPPPITFY